MAAPLNNRNAEKYNFKKAIELFNTAIELSEKKDENNAYEFDFIGEIAGELKTYHEVFTHLISRFPLLKRKYKLLINNLERNCYSNAKKGNIQIAVGILNLKSNHKWVDRVESENKNTNINHQSTHLDNLPAEEVRQMLLSALSDD